MKKTIFTLLVLLIAATSFAITVGGGGIRTGDTGITVGGDGINTSKPSSAAAPVSSSYNYRDTGGLVYRDTGGLNYRDY